MTESNGDYTKTTKPVSHLAILALGFGPIGLAAGLALLLYHYAGSWERFFHWGVAAFLIALGLAILSLAAYGIGLKIWYGDTNTNHEGLGGLSAIRDRRLAARTARIAAREAAMRQDGQVSVADDAPGRVSLSKR